MLGEANFSFSRAWLDKEEKETGNLNVGKYLTATELLGTWDLSQTYRDFQRNYDYLIEHKVRVRLGVDATKIHEIFKDQKFPHIREYLTNCVSSDKDMIIIERTDRWN